MNVFALRDFLIFESEKKSSAIGCGRLTTCIMFAFVSRFAYPSCGCLFSPPGALSAYS